MPEYRHIYVPGGTFFITLVTYQRKPLFSNPENISKLRYAVATARSEMPFEIVRAVVLPNHIHFLWTLPADDLAYSKRVGRLKVLFTQSLRGKGRLHKNISSSRAKHRESDVWQRRFWEHTIRNEADFERHLEYIHYNRVKHGFVSCPHLWGYSSFDRWVQKGMYKNDWCCGCCSQELTVPDFTGISEKAGE